MRRSFPIAFVFTLLCSVALVPRPAARVALDPLPDALTDHDFWALTSQLSEPNGYFVSRSGSPDNLLSNEPMLSTVAVALAERVQPNGVYLGVGPEQNFTYIAAIRPRIAFITDIRRGNRDLHLVYKAVFELSNSRADFVGRLFSRQRPAGLSSTSTAGEIMRAYLQAPTLSDDVFKANLSAIDEHLTRTRALPLGKDDLDGIDYVYRTFRQFGPAINYTSSITGRAGYGSSGTYASIVSTVDRMTGVEHSYLANDTIFGTVKTIESRNLIVPVVGDFAGPKALRAIGAYLKSHGAVVSAFYVSNVEDYLQRNGVWSSFCANVATLPLDASSVFIRPGSGMFLSSMAAETRACR
jgi:hypothetical protein